MTVFLTIPKRLWKWESRGIGGKTVVDYLIKVHGYTFVDAVRQLASDDYTFSSPPQRTSGAASRFPPVKKPLNSHRGIKQRKDDCLFAKNRTQINNQTFIIEVYFDHESKETFQDKLLRVMLADENASTPP